MFTPEARRASFLDQLSSVRRDSVPRSLPPYEGERERPPRGASPVGPPSLEQDISRTFKECEEAQNRATMFHEQLIYVTPSNAEDQNGDVLRVYPFHIVKVLCANNVWLFYQEFYRKAVKARDRAMSQLPWAQSLVEKSAAAKRERQLVISDAVDDSHNKPAPNRGIEAHLLDTLLATHQAMDEVCKMYEDLLRVAAAERVERYVEERSKIETRIDRSVRTSNFGYSSQLNKSRIFHFFQEHVCHC